MRLIGLLGGPATGKTTVMRCYLKSLGYAVSMKWKSIQYTFYSSKTYGRVIVLGVYDNKPFSGTDRLSASAINDACEFLKNIKDWKGQETNTVVFEGDKLSCDRFFKEAKESGYDLFLIKVAPSQEVLELRRSKRVQNRKWVQTRDTKVENLKNKWVVREMKNDDEIDKSRIVSAMLSFTM